MAPIAKATAPLARAWTRHTLSGAARAPSALKTPSTALALSASQRRGKADAQANLDPTHRPLATPNDMYTPYERSGSTARPTTDVPDFSKYKSGNSELGNRMFQYFVVGTFGAVTAMGAKATVQGESFRCQKEAN